MAPELGVLEAINTTRSLRRFRPDPIPRDILYQLIEAATRAPSGSNSQRWRFLVVQSPEARKKVGDVYRASWAEYSPPGRLAAITNPAERRRVETAIHLSETMGTEPPVLVIFCVPKAAPSANPAKALTDARTAGASIYPALQNMLLAARAHGIGGCLTTIHLFREQELKTALGIPDDVDTYAIVPLGYPTDNFGPLRRKPVEEVAFQDHWGTPLMRPPSGD